MKLFHLLQNTHSHCNHIQMQGRYYGGFKGAAPLHALKIINILSRFEIFSCSHGRRSVDGLDKICLKPLTLCVLLAYIEATVAREGHYICLGCGDDVILRHT